MQKYIYSFLIGIGFGSLSLILILELLRVAALTTYSLLICSLFSGLIGLYSTFLFNQIELPIKINFPIHFIITIIVISLMLVVGGFFPLHSLLNIGYLIMFLIIYALIWLIIYIMTHQNVKKINQKLEDREKRS